jgi:hypothetical protein
MSTKNVVISCRIALHDGRNSKSITKPIELDNAVIGNFRGAGKEDAFSAWVSTNYPGYVYAPHSGSLKTLADVGIKSPTKKQTVKKSSSPKTANKIGKSNSLIWSIVFLPFTIMWFMIKSIWKIFKWLSKD